MRAPRSLAREVDGGAPLQGFRVRNSWPVLPIKEDAAHEDPGLAVLFRGGAGLGEPASTDGGALVGVRGDDDPQSVRVDASVSPRSCPGNDVVAGELGQAEELLGAPAEIAGRTAEGDKAALDLGG